MRAPGLLAAQKPLPIAVDKPTKVANVWEFSSCAFGRVFESEVESSRIRGVSESSHVRALRLLTLRSRRLIQDSEVSDFSAPASLRDKD